MFARPLGYYCATGSGQRARPARRTHGTCLYLARRSCAPFEEGLLALAHIPASSSHRQHIILMSQPVLALALCVLCAVVARDNNGLLFVYASPPLSLSWPWSSSNAPRVYYKLVDAAHSGASIATRTDEPSSHRCRSVCAPFGTTCLQSSTSQRRLRRQRRQRRQRRCQFPVLVRVNSELDY